MYIVIDDVLAGTGLVLVPGTVAVSRGTVTSGNSPGDNAVGYSLDVLLLGETATITFETRLAAATPPASTVVNSASGDFDSAPLVDGRPGTIDADASLPVAPDIEKAVFSTSLPETGNAAFNPAFPDVAVGETVTYRITATLPQATISNFSISDLLPLGLAPVSASVVSVGSALTGSTLQPGDPGVVAGQTVAFSFGTIVNGGGTEVIGPEDTVVVEVTALVRDIQSNEPGAVLTDTASIGFVIGGRAGTDTATASVDVVGPELVVTKAVNHPTGDAGDSFIYTVTISHAATSTGPAFDLVLVDPLLPVLQPLSVSSSIGTATLVGQNVRLDVPELLQGDAPIVLTYVVRMTDAIEPGQQVPNLATLTFGSAPEGAGREDSDQAGAVVTGVLGVTLDKQIVETSLPQTVSSQFNRTLPDLAIGETVTYRLTATLSEGTQDFVITDVLPQGLVPISANLVATGSGIAAGPPVITIGGQTVEFDFGTVVNTGNNVAGDGTVIVEIEARVANAASNVAGKVLDNLATALIASPTSPNGPGGTVTDGASAAAEVVTPALIVDKSADTPFAAIGETVTYTIVVSHTPGSTAPAFDVVIDDPLAPGVMRLVSGTVITSEGIVLIGNGSGDGSIRIVVPELLLGQTVTITYSVEIIGVPTPAGAAINTAVVSGSSAPDEVPAEFVRNVSASDDAEVSISSGGILPRRRRVGPQSARGL